MFTDLVSTHSSFRAVDLLIFRHNIYSDIAQIVKHDWPAKWTSFIPDLVAAAKTSETICENCMIILKVRILT